VRMQRNNQSRVTCWHTSITPTRMYVAYGTRTYLLNDEGLRSVDLRKANYFLFTLLLLWVSRNTAR
jgi:hypothetical protein